MDDYIKRYDAVVYAVSLIDRIYEGTVAPRDIRKEARQQVINEMNSTDILPAADVRENVRGEWRNVVVRNKGDDVLKAIEAVASMQCPKCERWHNEVYLYGSPTEMSIFCPNCGADMRGEKK